MLGSRVANHRLYTRLFHLAILNFLLVACLLMQLGLCLCLVWKSVFAESKLGMVQAASIPI